jgi:hypothetical protein
MWIWEIVLAYYLGDLESYRESDLSETSASEEGDSEASASEEDDEEGGPPEGFREASAKKDGGLREASARALKYPSAEDRDDAFIQFFHTRTHQKSLSDISMLIVDFLQKSD